MKVLYYLILKPISLLPLWVLYGFSTVLYYLVFRVVGYRKDVVLKNLRTSFPEKNEQEIKRIADTFYRHFCDQIIESIKMFSISKKELRNRLEYINAEEVDFYTKNNRNVVICGGHYNNWEWTAAGFPLVSESKTSALYTPLTNKFMDEKVRVSRTKYGMNMVSRYQHKQLLKEAKEHGQALVFATDQSPKDYSKKIWTTFLNQRTAVFLGAENYARQLEAAVFFVKLSKKKRGYYRIELVLVTDDPLSQEEGKLTEMHTQMLEKQIIEKPAYWLWSHKRWKLKEEEDASVKK